jgi:dipeptidyl aminopeptidase/acylaminoacyl peptidase
MRLAVLCATVCVQACAYFPDHHLVHPTAPPAEVVTWTDEITSGDLLIHVRGARPSGAGPRPTVLVHPEGGKTAEAMQGVIWDLAGRGYTAIAADYERRIDGDYQPSLFTWRSADDVTVLIDAVEKYPEVDRQHIGVLGFSQGGVYSLLIAAYAPNRVKAVVAYYPVTDFPAWLGKERSGFGEGIAFAVVRWYFRRQSGARSEEEFGRMLHAASPYYVAESISAPVLLVHGDHDTTAPVAESQRMADRLRELGKPAELLIIPGGVHIFNFRQPREAAVAWQATVEWLDRYLRGTP